MAEKLSLGSERVGKNGYYNIMVLHWTYLDHISVLVIETSLNIEQIRSEQHPCGISTHRGISKENPYLRCVCTSYGHSTSGLDVSQLEQ